ncbi:MAG: PRC-barrel domain-containing protein [Beijerinckiaceae bacterium]|nr:PRC-barrel domain-containing protein [Beijerinckiaceae bacterium]
MKKILFASVCALSLAAPVAAQTSNSTNNNSNTLPADNSTTGSTTNRSTSAPSTSANQPPSLSSGSPSATNAAAPAAGSFPSIGATDVFSSKLRGLNIYNQDNRSIGEIADIAFNSSHTVEAYIVSVGGFLGLGERYVAISPSAVDVHWDASAKKWQAKMNATAEQLKAAPEFKYPNS